MLVSLFRRGIDWLLKAPIVDPLDRRNAAAFQILLLLVALTVPVMVFFSWLDVRRSLVEAATGIAVSAAAFFGIWLVRKGQYRVAVALMFSGLLAMIVLSYRAYGLRVHSGLQIAHLLPLLLGGLLLGRKALWWGLLVLFGGLLVGANVDMTQAGQMGVVREEIQSSLIMTTLTYFVATMVLDRLVEASRRSMRRSEELAEAYRRLAKEMEEKERTQAQLIQSQKLDALGRLAGDIAHDFNNILGVIMGYAGMARQQDFYSEAPINGIENAARRGALMTRRLLALGRNEVRQVELYDAAVAVRRAMTLIQPLFRGGTQTQLLIPEKEFPVMLDRDEFELTLLNLATNSRDAMPEGGLFTVEVKSRAREVLIQISDTGSGMRPEVKARMFDPFFTTKPEGYGTGVGMSTVQRFVSAMNGRIEVESEQGEGTCITIILPLAEMPTSADTPVMVNVSLLRVRVLVVEDDLQLRPVLVDALQKAGCEVLSAEDGATAYQLVKEQSIDVIVSDYRLPDTDGMCLMDGINRTHPGVLNILITSHHAGPLPELAGVSVLLLRKPFEMKQLIEMISRNLKR